MSRQHQSVHMNATANIRCILTFTNIFTSGYVQGGSDGMPIVGNFAVNYGAFAEELGVPSDDLYQALVDTAENTVSYWHNYPDLYSFKSTTSSRQTGMKVGLCAGENEHSVSKREISWQTKHGMDRIWLYSYELDRPLGICRVAYKRGIPCTRSELNAPSTLVYFDLSKQLLVCSGRLRSDGCRNSS